MDFGGDVGQLPVEQMPEGSTSKSAADDVIQAPPVGLHERFQCSQVEQAVREPKAEYQAETAMAPCTEIEQDTGPEAEFQPPCMGGEDNAIQRTEEQDICEEGTARGEIMKLKELGNVAFKEAMLNAALHFYVMALEREPSDDCLASTLHTNCAAVFLRMRDFGRAWESAESALEHDPDNAKALFRGAKAAQALGDVMQAARFCDRALELRPQDQDLLALQKDLIAQYADLPESLALGEQLLREAGEYQPASMD